MLFFLLILPIYSKLLTDYRYYTTEFDIIICPNMPIEIYDSVESAVLNTNYLNYFKMNFYYQTNNLPVFICITDTPSQTYFGQFTMGIDINNKLLLTPNSLYNVLLHEFGHVMGLDHSNSQGMMNYTLTATNINDTLYFVNDQKKLWWSYFDHYNIYKSFMRVVN